MANQFIKVKSVSDLGIKRTYVPLENDADFRQIQKNAWAFRLAAEFKAMKDQGWSIGFFTLTYDEAHLPVVPKMFWKDEADFERKCCFSRSDIREFLTKLRKHLSKVYRIENVKYMICSEFGETTRRSHYHGVICWPENGHTYYVERNFKGSVIKKEWNSLPCPADALHDAICRIWDKGFVRPRYASGGVDSHGHDHKPFKVDGDFTFCCKYAGKYCVKDMYFYESLQDYADKIDTKSPLFRKMCAPFHQQSKSLGLSILGEFTTDDQKLDLMINGLQFVGSDKFFKIPIYIRNKLVFDYYSVVDDHGERLCRRQANKFFRDNYEAIFEHKVSFYSSTFEKFLSSGYLVGRGVDADNADYVSFQVRNFLDSYSFTLDDLARSYLAWYGVDRDYCFDVPPANQWLGRYIPNEQTHTEGLSLVPDEFLDDLDWCVNCIMFGLGLIPVRLENRLVDSVRDFYKSEVS